MVRNLISQVQKSFESISKDKADLPYLEVELRLNDVKKKLHEIIDICASVYFRRFNQDIFQEIKYRERSSVAIEIMSYLKGKYFPEQ